MSARTLCAGGCGKTIIRSASSLPAGVATCHACRRAGRAPADAYRRGGRWRPCPVCGSNFIPSSGSRGLAKTCSRRCGCAARRDPSLPVDDLARARARNLLRCARRRGLLAAAFVEYVDPDVLFARDGWRCHICRRRVDRRLSGNHRMGATVDHLVPLADGGAHSYANTALAHRACNSSKGARAGNAQLALIG